MFGERRGVSPPSVARRVFSGGRLSPKVAVARRATIAIRRMAARAQHSEQCLYAVPPFWLADTRSVSMVSFCETDRDFRRKSPTRKTQRARQRPAMNEGIR